MLHLFNTTIGKLRLIGFAEGISYLVLLFIAMPLKYSWGKPEMVRICGSIHGVLFVLYVMYVLLCKTEYRWDNQKMIKLVLISMVPFGNFYADKHYLRT
jgi:integral membrane protein